MQIALPELWAFIHALESGEITLLPDSDPWTFYSGNLGYRASNGWRVVVFVDCGEWDYFDLIEASDGRVVTYNEMDDVPELRVYTPSLEVVQKRYGIPSV